MRTGTDNTAMQGHAAVMNRVYRRQRHFYDLTRKYYLFGRDTMLDAMAIPEGARVLEVGCGTGRNLTAAATRTPHALFYGFDISTQMLEVCGRQRPAQQRARPDLPRPGRCGELRRLRPIPRRRLRPGFPVLHGLDDTRVATGNPPRPHPTETRRQPSPRRFRHHGQLAGLCPRRHAALAGPVPCNTSREP